MRVLNKPEGSSQTQVAEYAYEFNMEAGIIINDQKKKYCIEENLIFPDKKYNIHYI